MTSVYVPPVQAHRPGDHRHDHTDVHGPVGPAHGPVRPVLLVHASAEHVGRRH